MRLETLKRIREEKEIDTTYKEKQNQKKKKNVEQMGEKTSLLQFLLFLCLQI